eukprot:24837_4
MRSRRYLPAMAVRREVLPAPGTPKRLRLYWKRLASKTSRSIESVVLPDETKEKIISDIDSFISRETFQFYTNHGIS